LEPRDKHVCATADLGVPRPIFSEIGLNFRKILLLRVLADNRQQRAFRRVAFPPFLGESLSNLFLESRSTSESLQQFLFPQKNRQGLPLCE